MYDIVLGRSVGDTKKLGTKGTVMIGKQYVQMGQTSSLSNPIYLDVARAHAMLIVGKRGGGKCLLGNSGIILADGRIVKIEDMAQEFEQIFSVTEKYKVNSDNTSHWYKRKSKEILKITLNSGKELELTPEHPLLTVNEYKQVKNLKIGERIATPRKIPVEGKKSIGISKVKILAYLIAEGHLGNNFVLFSNTEDILVQDFKKSIYAFDNTLKINKHGKDNYRVVQYNKRKNLITRNLKGQIVSSKTLNCKSTLRDWLDEINLYGTNSHTKFIPKCIFTSPNSELKEFLNIYFSCDGCIYEKSNNYWQISVCSVSKEIIKQISHLLLRFGIVNRFRQRKIRYKEKINIAYELYIEGQFVKKFIEEIGFTGKKKIRAKKALEGFKLKIRNPNKDNIPKEIWQRYKPSISWTKIGEALNYKFPKSVREALRYSPSRNKLSKIAQADDNEEIYNLANSDIHWDSIVSIEKMVGNFDVYDLTCPNYNNFIANDIVVHNSYTMGSIAEGLADMDPDISKNLSFLMLDTMGVYWSMKYPNNKEEDLLSKWGIEGKGLGVQIYVPGGFFEKYKEDGIPVDYPFYIRPNELSAEDWLNAFKLTTDDAVGVGIQRVIGRLLNKGENFSLNDVISDLEKDERLENKTKFAAINRIENAKTWGIFSKKGTQIKNLLKGGIVTIMDLSPYVAMPGGWDVKSLVLGIIAKKIFVERMLVRKREELYDIINKTQVVREEEVKEDLPMPWLIVDEAHEFLPRDEIVPSSQALITILREGRQPGVSLILATQQPARIHTDAITQSDLVLAHRLTASFDLEALDKIFLSYNSKGSRTLFNSMPRTKGCAIIMDDKNERLHTMQVKPRFSWHGGEDPNAISEVKDEFDFD